jgi:hypothetical protein
MANYDLAVSWSGKDALADSDASKVISGGDFHTEFTAVKAAVNTKADVNGSASEAFSATTASAGNNTTLVATTAFVGAALTAATINALVYPVGSIYFNAAVATNPNTLLGFGTWAAYGGGRVMVGVHSSGTFDGLNETGGAETHTLSVSEMPSHAHDVVGMASRQDTWNEPISSSVALAGEDTGSTTNAGGFTIAAGGGAAHNNIQPYITVYMWKRTG